MLHAAAVAELITSNLQDYEALALRLARDPDRLTEIKAKVAAHRDIVHYLIPVASRAISKWPTRRCGRSGNVVKRRGALVSNHLTRPVLFS